MPTLALAGGTSASLGRAIVAAVISETQWNVLILSRSTKAPLWLRAIDPDAKRHTVAAVDYASVDSLTETLRAQTAHTVISVASAVDGTQYQTQANLIHAAVKAGCKRFAPTQWGFGPKGYDNVPSLQWANQGVREACQEYKGQIEYAYFNHGSFMNYIGIGIYPTPGPAVSDDEALEQLSAGQGYRAGEDAATEGVQRQGPLADKSGAFLIGMTSGIAELPIKDDGTWPRISLTSSRDVGRFVAASLDLPRWEEEMGIAGDTLTMGELLEAAEAVTGRKFEVKRLERRALEERLVKTPEYEFMERLWIEFDLAYIRDQEDEVVLDPVVNRLCPSVRPTTVREYMEKHWAASQ